MNRLSETQVEDLADIVRESMEEHASKAAGFAALRTLLSELAELRAELKEARSKPSSEKIVELTEENARLRAEQLRKDRTIIALNESYKALRDHLGPKLADITEKRNKLESRLSRAIAALHQVAEIARAQRVQWRLTGDCRAESHCGTYLPGSKADAIEDMANAILAELEK